jgi:urocanate hydratase
MSNLTFAQDIQQGIPTIIPAKKAFDPTVNHAPKRKEILSKEEKK